MPETIARFRFKKYHILKSSIEFYDISTIDKELEIEIKKSDEVNDEANNFKLSFDINIKDKNKSFNIDISTEGFFEFDKDLNENDRDLFFNVNAPAILFPYIRAYISTLTSLSGICPIILPTINLTGRK